MTANPNKTTTVTTQIVTQKKGRPLTINVNYVLNAANHAVDIITDDAPLTQTYHDMFKKLMDNGGCQNLNTKMTNSCSSWVPTPRRAARRARPRRPPGRRPSRTSNSRSDMVAACRRIRAAADAWLLKIEPVTAAELRAAARAATATPMPPSPRS